jgi:glycosyltransferase involved in cell wall biosynthesis
MNIWLMQTGEPLHIDAGNARPMRAMNLANALVDAGHTVVIWSAAFNHQEKRHRTQYKDRIVVSPRLEIRLISSPGYRRNVSVNRLWDHLVLARNLYKCLNHETLPPDVAFVGYPPIETAAVMTRWLSDRGVPFILDVKDLWPTLFLNALPAGLGPFGRVALAPYFHFARRAMRDATGLSSMADGFLRWAIEFRGTPRSQMDLVIPLTSPVDQVSRSNLEEARRWLVSKDIVDDGRPRFYFVGSHSVSFDLDPIWEAAASLLAQGSQCEFVICGEGEETASWRNISSDLSNIRFLGWVDRSQAKALAGISFAALAPYKNTPDFTRSIPNKIIDSLSMGTALLSPLQGEVATLISAHKVGLRYGTDTGKTLAECIDLLIASPSLRRKMSENALALYVESFSFEKVYGGLVKHLELLSRNSKRCP